MEGLAYKNVSKLTPKSFMRSDLGVFLGRVGRKFWQEEVFKACGRFHKYFTLVIYSCRKLSGVLKY
jgi:hypothetical protein